MAKSKRARSFALSVSTLAVAICINTRKIDAFSLRTNLATSFITSNNILHSDDAMSALGRCGRGGAIDLDDDEYDVDEEYDVEEYDSDIEEDEESSLAAAAVAAVAKAKKKKAEEAKRLMSDAIRVSKVATEVKKRKMNKPSLLKKIPYILRALVNPFTVLAMTRGYFASLINIDYMQEDSSQNLRSALEEKARKSGSARGKRARKMRPGQAKTLSDLPQLSA